MVFAVVTGTRICTKSVAKMAFSGTRCGAAGVVPGPGLVVRIVAHDLRSEAHVAEDPADVHRLDLPGEEPVDERRVVDAGPVLPEDLPAGGRAEVGGPAGAAGR